MRRLLLEPSRHAVAAAERAYHITVIVEHHVDPVGVREVEHRVQPAQEVCVKRVLVARLRAGPHHAQTDEIPPPALDVINVRLVEGGACLARAGGGALVRDNIVADLGAGHERHVRRTLDHDVRAPQHNGRIRSSINE